MQPTQAGDRPGIPGVTSCVGWRPAKAYEIASRSSTNEQLGFGAELATYASNAFLALEISYINSLAALCARVGADIDAVTRCMGAGCPLDRWIGGRRVDAAQDPGGTQLMPYSISSLAS